MRLLQVIWKDILWVTRLSRAGKIAILVVVILLVVVAWYPGAEWWNTRVAAAYGGTIPRPRYEKMLVLLGIFLLLYLISIFERYLKSHRIRKRSTPSN